MPIVALDQLTPELLRDAQEIVAEDARHYARFAVLWRRPTGRRKGKSELVIRLQRLDRHSFECVQQRLAELGLGNFEPAPLLLQRRTRRTQ